MATQRDLYILDVQAPEFAGLFKELQHVEAGLKGVATSFQKAFAAPEAQAALSKNLTLMAATAEQVTKLGQAQTELASNSGKIGFGNAAVNLKQYATELDRTLKLVRELRTEYQASGKSTKELDSLINQIGNFAKGSLGALGRAAGKGDVAALLTKLSEDAKVARFEFDKLSKAQAQFASQEAKQQQMTAAVQRTGQVAAEAAQQFRQLGLKNLGVEQATSAYETLLKIFSQFNASSAEQAKIGRVVADSFREQAKALVEVSAAADAQIRTQAKLRSLSADLVLGKANRGKITSGEAVGVQERVAARIDKGELQNELQIRRAITAETAAQRRNQETLNKLAGETLNALSQEKRYEAEITDYLVKQARATGADVKLKGDLRSVLAEVAAQAKSAGIELNKDADALDRLLRDTVALKQVQQEGAPKQLNEFGIAFATGFAAQGIGQVLGDAVSKVREFEDALINVRRTANASRETMNALGEEIFAIGQRVPVAAAELAKAAGALGQVGAINFLPDVDYAKNTKEIQDAAKAIELVGQVSQVAGIEINTVATGYGQIATIFDKDIARINDSLKRQGVEVVGVSNAMQYLFGAINQVENATVATTQDVLDFTLRFGGLASSLGISAETVIGLSGAMRNFGVSTEVAGTAMTRFFSRATDDAEAFGRVLGVSGEAFRAEFGQDAFGTVTKVFKELNQQVKTNKLAIQDFLTAVNVETRERNAVTKLIEGFDKLPDFIKLATDAQKNYNSVSTESAKKGETFTAALTRLSNAFLAVLDKGRPLLDLLGRIAGKIADFVQAFSETGFAGATVVIGGITAAVSFLVLKFVSLVQQIRLATQGLAAMGLQAKELAAAMRQIPASPTQVGGKPTPGKGSVVGGIVAGAAATAGAAAIFSSDDVDEASKEAEKAGEKVGTSFGEGVANTAGTVVEYGAYAAVFAGFTALATKIGGLLAASGLWASITAGFSAGFAAIGTAIAGFAASLAAAVLSPIVAVAGVIAAAITAPLAVEAALVVAEAKKAEKDAERAQKRQDRAVKTFAALRTETEAVTSSIASANERMSGFAAQLAATAEKADESKYAVLSLSKLLETLGKTKDLGTADDILTEINKRADAVRANVEKTQKDALAAFTAYAERIKKLGADINPTELIFGKEDIQAGTAKVKSALKEREAEVRAALKRNRQLAGQLIAESKGDTSGSQEILNTLAVRNGELQGQLKEIRAAQDELDAKVTTELSKALGESTDAALAAEAELRAIAQRARDRLARQADQANQRVVDDLSTDVTAFLTGAEDVNNKLIAELEQKRTNFINNLTKALERPGLTAEKRATLAALLEKVTGDEFVALAEETIGTEIRKRVNLKLTDIKEAVDNFFEGVELEQRFKDFEQRVAQTEKKIKLDALTDDIEDLTEKRGKLTSLADAFSELEDLRLSGVSNGLKSTEKAIAELEAPTLKYLDTIDKLVLAFSALEDNGESAFKAITEGAEGAKRAAQQGAFDFGLNAGKDLAAAKQQTQDSGTFLRQSSTARDLVGAINKIRRQGGDEAEQGKRIGEAIAAAQDKLGKQGRADDPNAKAFFDRLNSDLGDLFTDPERTTPEEELRKSVEDVGAETNLLLTSIDASLKNLGKTDVLGDLIPPDTANIREGLARSGSTAASASARARGRGAALDTEIQGVEGRKTSLEREIQLAERQRSRERERLDQQRTGAGLLIDRARQDITGQVGREGAISAEQEAAIRKRIQELLNSREFSALRTSLGEQAFGKLQKLEGPDRDVISERLRSTGLEQKSRISEAEGQRLVDSAKLTGQAGDRAADAISQLVAAVETSNQSIAQRFAAIEKIVNDAKLSVGKP